MSKILIIDDDDHVCVALSAILRRQGHEVTTASDGKAGLILATSASPDLIICDLEMPLLDGQGVVFALRQDRRLGEVPVIFLSGCTDRGEIRNSMNLGGDDFITKPAQPVEILAAVNARLARRQKQIRQLDQEIEQGAEIFVGISHDLNPAAPEVRWLADTAAASAAQQNKIVQRVRQSLAADPLSTKPVAAVPARPASLLIKNHRRQQFLKLSEVKALLANGEYSNIYWGLDQCLMFRKSLKQWETELPPERFVRVHRQAIVNLAHLDFVEKDSTGRPRIHLREFKPVIPVSQRATAVLNRRLKTFQVDIA